VGVLVSSVQAESARPVGDDGRARPVDGAHDHHALRDCCTASGNAVLRALSLQGESEECLLVPTICIRGGLHRQYLPQNLRFFCGAVSGCALLQGLA
jgi:hypothetical protein